jgi:hypothetical protein
VYVYHVTLGAKVEVEGRSTAEIADVAFDVPSVGETERETAFAAAEAELIDRLRSIVPAGDFILTLSAAVAYTMDGPDSAWTIPGITRRDAIHPLGDGTFLRAGEGEKPRTFEDIALGIKVEAFAPIEAD